ncbi:SUKH-3 domain-containing protein [Vitiosangium sp. GDMCC 1.1324]|uniref:SUKH-3 domain-containing protein n=1 Tax=Vitiosangium sp. (strain GDMCC 1.1324) TaxID=2138576 RepID=UPI000D38F3D4|nr:SUKH-3 domain-containing protein [Vitiosangium sp. GDMCC 1.1324]PTL81070.1 hypothetical protein DAT35_23335 [Vitiosangium sp. GDMCC 1.1324]
MTTYDAAVRSLSEKVLELLRERGWGVDRSVPLDEAKASLTSQGATLHAYAEELLHAFEGLQFHNPATSRTLKMSAVDTCAWMDEGELPYVQALFAPSACPVALGAYSSPELPITDSPTFFGSSFPDCFFFVAEDGRWLCIDIYWAGAWFFPKPPCLPAPGDCFLLDGLQAAPLSRIGGMGAVLRERAGSEGWRLSSGATWAMRLPGSTRSATRLTKDSASPSAIRNPSYRTRELTREM